MVNMTVPFERVIQVFVFIIFWNGVNSSGIVKDAAVSKLQKIPIYRFHYYARDDKNGSDSNEAVHTVDNHTENSGGLQTEVTANAGTSLFQSVLNHTPRQQSNNTLNSTISPINVEPINIHERKSVKVDSTDHLVDDYSTTQLIEQVTTNQPKDRGTYNVIDEQVTDQIFYQNDRVSNKQFELTLPLEKQLTMNSNDTKYSNDQVIKQNIIKVIENIKDHEQSGPELYFGLFYRQILKIIDALKTEPQKSSQTSTNKPLKLLGYNAATIGSQYDMNSHYNQTSQVQQQHTPEFSADSDKIKSHIHASSTIQPISQQEHEKYLTPIIYTQPYYYNPISMIMYPISNGMIHNTYSFFDNKLQPTQLVEPRKKFNIIKFLRGRGKRSIKMPEDDIQINNGPLKITLVQSSQLNHDGHMRFGFSPTNPDTPIDSMPICKDCNPISESDKRSLNILLNDHQKSPDPTEITSQLLWPQAIKVSANRSKQTT